MKCERGQSRCINENEANRSLRRSHDFLVFRSDEHSGDTYELELDERDDTVRKESIDNVDGDPKSFGKHVIPHVNLQEPVNESRTHRPVGRDRGHAHVEEVRKRRRTYHSISLW